MVWSCMVNVGRQPEVSPEASLVAWLLRRALSEFQREQQPVLAWVALRALLRPPRTAPGEADSGSAVPALP